MFDLFKSTHPPSKKESSPLDNITILIKNKIKAEMQKHTTLEQLKITLETFLREIKQEINKLTTTQNNKLLEELKTVLIKLSDEDKKMTINVWLEKNKPSIDDSLHIQKREPYSSINSISNKLPNTKQIIINDII
jgi:hypothetical protein